MSTLPPEQELVDYEEEDQVLPTGGVSGKEKLETAGGEEVGRGNYVAIHASGFRDFFLKPELVRAIGDAGFEHPSEVQHETIPHAITGVDILCQAKSGMGKTAVFVLSILQQLNTETIEAGAVHCLGLAHTRELAFQIKNEFDRFGKYLSGIKCEVVYGGVPIQKNIEMLTKTETCPQVLVGTPGRVLALIRQLILKTEKISHFVLDECDKCLEKLDMRKDVQDIFMKAPRKKQVMMFSATMNKEIRDVCKRFMHSPVEVFVDDETKLTLHGLLQYYCKLNETDKNRRLNDLLDTLEFNQVIVFVKSVQRAQALDKLLTECHFPSICIHAALEQPERISRYQQFKNFEKRIMVATDLFGRGIDIERVNIVINYDMPDSTDSYLHRVGRAGRFGTKGLAVTFVASQDDSEMLNQVQSRFEIAKSHESVTKQMPSMLNTKQVDVGDVLPYTLVTLNGQTISITEYFQNRTGVLFGLPGAFTPTCSEKHLPGFRDLAKEIKRRVGFLGCVVVQDAYVLKAWAKSIGASKDITYIADFQGEFCRDAGLLQDLTDEGLGLRAKRFAMIVDRGAKILWMGLGEDAFAGNLMKALEGFNHLNELEPKDVTHLVAEALAAKSHSHAPYSKRPAGVAVMTDKGLFKGCTLDNCAYPNSICSVRSALVCAASSGATKISLLAMVGNKEDAYANPCGHCREAMTEYGDFAVVLAKPDGVHFKTTTVHELLPGAVFSSAFCHGKRPSFRLPKEYDYTGDEKLDDSILKLCMTAIAAAGDAYAPYSMFPVGAALITDAGVFSGSNTESSVFGSTLCAERTAMCKAVVGGAKKMKALAVVCQILDDFGRPCGGCRQNLVEFGKFPVHMIKLDHKKCTFDVETTTSLDLLPAAFTPAALD